MELTGTPRARALVAVAVVVLAAGGLLAADAPDGDGLSTGAELAGATSPLDADTDGDGVPDGREVAGGTDPTRADTDGDGLADPTELDRGTDPTAPDTDGDGLADPTELDEGTDPTRADTDGDGLDDGSELDLETDPRDVDTDGDGLRDGWEENRPGVFPGASPTRRDVFVEIDRVRGCTVRRDQLRTVVERFADAPVENPGTDGIALHLAVDDRIPAENRSQFDHRGQGYHYATVTPDLPRDEPVGFAVPGRMWIACDLPQGAEQGSVFMHELGHSLGLAPVLYRGIDSTAVSASDYPSVMNYNTPNDAYRYSSDAGFDDWAFIERLMFVPPTDALES